MKAIRALDNLIIVKQKVETKTKSGIILTEEATRNGSMECFEGEVIAVGEKVTKFKKGDYVLFGRNVFASMKRYGREFLLMYDRDVNCLEFEPTSDELTQSEFILEDHINE